MSFYFFTALVSQATPRMLFFDMKITVSVLIIQIIEPLDEDQCCEEFYTDNSLLVICKKHLIDVFVFDPFCCLH